MARKLTTQEAKQAVTQMQTLRLALQDTVALRDTQQRAIADACEVLRESILHQLLRDVPVEELGRDLRGIKIKPLREHGYATLYDLLPVSCAQLEEIRGISAEGAAQIREQLIQWVQTARQTTRIRLTVDERTPQADALTQALAQALADGAALALCQAQQPKLEMPLQTLSQALQVATTSLGWLFASKARKAKAEEAYQSWQTLCAQRALQQLQQTLQQLSTRKALSVDAAWAAFQRDPIAFTTLLEQIVPGCLGNTDAQYGLPQAISEAVQQQSVLTLGLQCTLRRYQEWGVKYILHQQKVLLGDEMGLGKTVQAIAAMVSLCNEGGMHFLVVCPSAVLSNWCREIRKHSRLRLVQVHGRDRTEEVQDWLDGGGVAVTTYESTDAMVLPDTLQLAMLVVDEAHYIKNPAAQRTQRVQKLAAHAQRLLFMTGTALENNVEEMIRLLGMLRADICADVQDMTFLASAPQFREKIAPVYYRRRREDVLGELPELVESEEWCTPNAVERQHYEQAILQKQFAQARRVSWHVPQLQQSSKATRLLQLVEEAAADGRKVIVFSFFLDTIRSVCTLLGERCSQPITGAVPPEQRQQLLDAFSAAPNGAVLPAQIQAGGTGLNIQSASVVILCEPQLKPSIEQQAIARAYRMGQTRNVLVYRLLCDDTIDERILELLSEKQNVFDAFADDSAAAQGSREVDEKTFGTLVEAEIERIRAKNAQDTQPAATPAVPTGKVAGEAVTTTERMPC